LTEDRQAGACGGWRRAGGESGDSARPITRLRAGRTPPSSPAAMLFCAWPAFARLALNSLWRGWS